jgi:hypothetical protein
MPLDYGRGLHEHHQLEAARPHPVEPDPNDTIYCEQPNPTAMPATQNRQLVTKRDNLKLQGRATTAPASEPCAEFRQQYEHPATLRLVAQNRQTFHAFGVFSRDKTKRNGKRAFDA